MSHLIANPTIENKASHYDVVVVGGGAAGIATTASLLSREPHLNIVIIDPANCHYYQPGWTLVGAGVFKPQQTAKPMADVIPNKASWLKHAVKYFNPKQSQVILSNNQALNYRMLIVAAGIKLDWAAIEGLPQALGRQGITSNYSFELAPYTWQLVTQLKSGRAIFTQPPLPIKCAGAPQKALYLSADYWKQHKRLSNIDIAFYNAGDALFGVKEYVPALMQYIQKYSVSLHFKHNLTAVDANSKTAIFTQTTADASQKIIEKSFDLLHVCPPQLAPDFIRNSPLADKNGWLSVYPDTLQHTQYSNIFGVGDICSTPNAKTAAAARKQAPVVAENVIHCLNGNNPTVAYNGYGSCPLTVERGKIILAEFLYGGKVAPTFPGWLNEGTQPSRLAWHLKQKVLPAVYWHAMLKGREWLAKPSKAK
ncbi:NAD(P)/FAD-dependent oxidoreductase [Spartinivicinus ruber]|uniref:NAD(P)/FAD-dependent oxidoreductase n=1 Tax=Spartinivicinus ruber TaxID=2683272 RepID=UPI0013CF7EFD|nr:FAD/NAD(P)-binding oxidoreductase [Spartinivicinus ruber]